MSIANEARSLAISDCKYALSLGRTAFNQHINIWCNFTSPMVDMDFDKEYLTALIEIKSKEGTEECLLA